eukprot:gnl/TRDRNA2_/TRDRNA2_90725_c1_seq2.p1 gnl/TRDRNA2_/TRDRNA2_90725_c1~~gnl/TRDRNA2_/TRDRNA2_90725_c1_seq2.p1  ORF type:complete len:154 (+),score=25.94 gnl/TRDRNA2_/TRDRNA2_90725_c1_seq2:60-521(+)
MADDITRICCEILVVLSLCSVYLGLLSVTAAISDPFGTDIIDFAEQQLEQKLYMDIRLLTEFRNSPTKVPIPQGPPVPPPEHSHKHAAAAAAVAACPDVAAVAVDGVPPVPAAPQIAGRVDSFAPAALAAKVVPWERCEIPWGIAARTPAAQQ